MPSKRKSEAQMLGEEAIEIVKGLLPKHWTAREYQPDYGLDLAVEVFDEPTTGPVGHVTCDTLGEHFFLQVKGAKQLRSKTLTLHPRLNVERFDLASTPGPRHDGELSINIFPFQLETSELVTVQKMGAAIPVLLVLADLSQSRAYFVCLNDYIDKILLPSDPAFAEQSTKVVHVPERNEITNDERNRVPLRFYAKRAKLMAAFQKFAYQRNELKYTDNASLRETTTHFAKLLLRYDFWTACDFWFPIRHAHQGLENLLRDGTTGQQRIDVEVVRHLTERGAVWTDDHSGEACTLPELLAFQEIRTLWDQLANLGHIHEEICREWFLPTHLGATSS